MSQRRVKQIRRQVRQAREVIVHASFEDTLALPFRDRWEIAIAILTRRRSWLLAIPVVGFLIASLIALLVIVG